MPLANIMQESGRKGRRIVTKSATYPLGDVVSVALVDGGLIPEQVGGVRGKNLVDLVLSFGTQPFASHHSKKARDKVPTLAQRRHFEMVYADRRVLQSTQ